MESCTVRLINDGTRRILVFENVSNEDDARIGDLLKMFMFPSTTINAPYADTPDNSIQNEVTTDILNTVEESEGAKKTQITDNNGNSVNFIDATEDAFAKILATKPSFKVVLPNTTKAQLSLNLSINQVKHLFYSLVNGENPLEASGINMEDAYWHIYALLAYALATKKFASEVNNIDLYHIMGYEGSLSECESAADKHKQKSRVLPLKMLKIEKE